ncbi:allophycocyanin subunit beta [Anthocerotibacter panamensis]|uniref:ApcB3 n=1 Tax=Anthocerotibacter panamensis TaxID=2857077 RepID=A0AAJ6N6E1_9CYAN|nr:allophycocyanin subunit beta [Anthocerotibacter panamensis]8IMI_G Chain G, ApcB3 [Anthocerotibacter panamensis]8IMJ_G Chain G, ApcB3 [Anthocerotibacter panamensis]
MQDVIGKVIAEYDTKGKYLDAAALDLLRSYFDSGDLRLKAAQAITANAEVIVRAASAKALHYTPVTKPGGNMYYARRYASCIRDLDYFLRYATYAMLADNTTLLDEYVLKGLTETYRALGVPLDISVRAINALKEVVAGQVGPKAGQEMAKYFDHLAKGLG